MVLGCETLNLKLGELKLRELTVSHNTGRFAREVLLLVAFAQSHNVSRMSYHARQGADRFRGKTKMLRLGNTVMT